MDSFLRFTTPHYKFDLTLTETKESVRKFYFIVGDKTKPCLEGSIILENISKNERFDYMVNTAHLMNIKALQECSLDDISDEYMAKYSFGKELLDSIIYFVNSQFPMIKTMSLNDTSYIPCIRADSETLDLLTYSIALYKKTWYEEKINAYIKPKPLHTEYRKQVEIYASPERKNKMIFAEMKLIMEKGSYLSRINFHTKKHLYEDLFNKAETLPDYFKALNSTIQRNERCIFFKGWLENFINSEIRVERTWYFDFYPKIQEITRRNLTRRNRK